MTKHLAAVYGSLSMMLGAGLPLRQALRHTTSLGKGRLQGALSDVGERAGRGVSLAEAMAKHPRVFAPLDVIMVDVGEQSGQLPDAVKMLSEWYAHVLRMRRTVLSGLILPIIVLHAAALVSPLPAFILGAVGFAGYFWAVAKTVALFYVPAAVVVAVRRLTPDTGPLRRVFDSFLLALPLVGRAVRHLALSRFCRAFYMLLKSGVPAVQSADRAIQAAGNAAVADLLRGGVQSARSGHLISEGFSSRLPRPFIDSWRIGEETGSLDDVARRLGDDAAEVSELMFTEMAKWFPRIVYFFVCLLMIARILSMAPR